MKHEAREGMTPKESITAAVRSLGLEEAQTLELLYGFGGRGRSTVEEVARVLGCPVDAVFKMEAAAIRKLRHPRLFKSIVQALDASVEDMWGALAGPDHLLFKTDLHATVDECLPGEYSVALRAEYGGIHPWLEANACETSKAWYRGRYACEELEHAVARVEEAQQELSMPAPIQGIARYLGLGMDLFILAAKLADYAFIYKGYLTNVSYEVRVARAIEMHLFLAFQCGGRPTRMGSFVEDYNARFPEKPISMDYVESFLRAYPHLFMRFGDLGWAGIGLPEEDLSYINVGAPPAATDTDGRLLRHPTGKEDEVSEVNPLPILREILGAGPLHASRLRAGFAEKLAGDFKMKALYSALQGCHDIVLIAPEIHALREHTCDPRLMESALDLLLTTRHCLLYAVIRHAGEPADTFPLWKLMGEERLCRWADQHCRRPLFSMLLAVVDPDGWDAPRSVRDLWLFKKDLAQRHVPRPAEIKKPVWRVLPSLDKVLAAALHAHSLGYGNWWRIQHVLIRQMLEQPYDQTAVPALALLVALGVLAPADHWQKRHELGPEAGRVIHELTLRLHQEGSLSWKDEMGREMAERVQNVRPDANLGWVCWEDLQRLMNVLTTSDHGVSEGPIPCREESIEGEMDGSSKVGPLPQQLSLPFPRRGNMPA